MPKKPRAAALADAAKRAELRFPEPFYWTTRRLKVSTPSQSGTFCSL